METVLHPNGAVKSITRKANGRLHGDNGPNSLNCPAYQEWNDARVLIREEWYQHGRMHRDNGPAYRRWNDAGILIREEWYHNGRCHRDNGPNGFAERNGPAYQEWNNAGELIAEGWWQNDLKLTPQEIEKILRPENIMAALREGLPQPIFEEIESVFRAV